MMNAQLPRQVPGLLLIKNLDSMYVDIEELKHKMQCYNKSQLIQKSVESGYIDVIPPSIMNLENNPLR